MSKLSSSTSGSGCRGFFEHLCHACQLGRHVRLPFPTSSSRAAGIFYLIHCDVWTSPVISISGYKYYLLIIDDFSHYLWTFALRQMSDTYPTLSHFFAWVSTQFGRTIRSIQCDNGREFYSNVSRDLFLSRGIHLRMSCPYTSHQNDRAKRMIRMTNDGCALYFSRLPFPLITGLRPSPLPPTSSTVSPPRRLPTPLLTSLSSASILLTNIFVSSGALATAISHPLLLISSPLAPLVVSSSATPLTIGVSVS
jgi:transposase InsO family protein